MLAWLTDMLPIMKPVKYIRPIRKCVAFKVLCPIHAITSKEIAGGLPPHELFPVRAQYIYFLYCCVVYYTIPRVRNNKREQKGLFVPAESIGSNVKQARGMGWRKVYYKILRCPSKHLRLQSHLCAHKYTAVYGCLFCK